MEGMDDFEEHEEDTVLDNVVRCRDENDGESNECSETNVFLAKFCGEGGNTYKICPEKWTIDDQGFGIDLTWCKGEVQPMSFVDIKREVMRATEGLQT